MNRILYFETSNNKKNNASLIRMNDKLTQGTVTVAIWKYQYDRVFDVVIKNVLNLTTNLL